MIIKQTDVTLRNTIGPPYVSERGAELFCDGVSDLPVLTVENYMKWYTLYIIYPDGSVTQFENHKNLEDTFVEEYGESAYGDHVFNPRFVLFLARHYGMEVPYSALESIIGRWRLEHCNEDFSTPSAKVSDSEYAEPLFQREYLGVPWTPNPKEKRLRELAREYHERTEAYDRTICTGPIVCYGIMPVTPEQRALINRHAVTVRDELGIEAARLGFSTKQWREAISKAALWT